MGSMSAGIEHHVRPSKSLSKLQITPEVFHSSGVYKFRMFMITLRFLMVLLVWFLKWQKRDRAVVKCMFELIQQVCELLPDCTMYVSEVFSVPVSGHHVNVVYVLALIGHLQVSGCWEKLGVDVPDMMHLIESKGNVHVAYVVLMVFRLADSSASAMALAREWCITISQKLDDSELGGRLQTSLPVVSLPRNCRIEHKRLVRGDDKILLSAHTFLAKRTGFALTEQDVFLKDPIPDSRGLRHIRRPPSTSSLEVSFWPR